VGSFATSRAANQRRRDLAVDLHTRILAEAGARFYPGWASIASVTAVEDCSGVITGPA